jgi:hypothetical protein
MKNTELRVRTAKAMAIAMKAVIGGFCVAAALEAAENVFTVPNPSVRVVNGQPFFIEQLPVLTGFARERLADGSIVQLITQEEYDTGNTRNIPEGGGSFRTVKIYETREALGPHVFVRNYFPGPEEIGRRVMVPALSLERTENVSGQAMRIYDHGTPQQADVSISSRMGEVRRPPLERPQRQPPRDIHRSKPIVPPHFDREEYILKNLGPESRKRYEAGARFHQWPDASSRGAPAWPTYHPALRN